MNAAQRTTADRLAAPSVLVADDPGVGPGARTTLWTVRLLGEAGYRPHVVTPDPASMAAASRYADGRTRMPPDADDATFRRIVEEACDRLSAVEILPCGDRGVVALQPAYRSLVDKVCLLDRVREAGLTSPPTSVVQDVGDLDRVVARAGFPAVVKPAAGHGARVVASGSEARAIASHLEFPLLVQPYLDAPIRSIAGVRFDGGYIAIVHQRFDRIWPPHAGMATAATTIEPDLELEARVGALLDGYEGVFQVQFLGPHVMDVNLRVYASLSLARVAGVNLPAMLCDARRGLAGPLRRARVGVRYRWLDGDLRSIVAHIRSGRMSIDEGLHAFLPRPGTARGGPESLRDPRPIVARIWATVSHRMQRRTEHPGVVPGSEP